MTPASAADLVVHFGMTARYWTRMAAEGRVPSAWQPSGGGGKWLFDLQAVARWRQDSLKRVKSWQGYTSGERRTGAAPSVTGSNTDSASAPKIDALLKSVFANG
jgi:hypothetical protein